MIRNKNKKKIKKNNDTKIKFYEYALFPKVTNLFDFNKAKV